MCMVDLEFYGTSRPVRGVYGIFCMVYKAVRAFFKQKNCKYQIACGFKVLMTNLRIR